MSKHTKGPWTADIVDDMLWEINSSGADWASIAEVTANILGALRVSTEDAEANAWLIAAAPELLEACKAILASAPNQVMRDTHPYAIALKAVRAAIAKAEGGAP